MIAYQEMTRHCDRCGGQHYTKMCKATAASARGVKKRKRTRRRCPNCDELGHFSKTCPQPQRILSSQQLKVTESKKKQKLKQNAKLGMEKGRAKQSKEQTAEKRGTNTVRMQKTRGSLTEEKKAENTSTNTARRQKTRETIRAKKLAEKPACCTRCTLITIVDFGCVCVYYNA